MQTVGSGGLVASFKQDKMKERRKLHSRRLLRKAFTPTDLLSRRRAAQVTVGMANFIRSPAHPIPSGSLRS